MKIFSAWYLQNNERLGEYHFILEKMYHAVTHKKLFWISPELIKFNLWARMFINYLRKSHWLSKCKILIKKLRILYQKIPHVCNTADEWHRTWATPEGKIIYSHYFKRCWAHWFLSYMQLYEISSSRKENLMSLLLKKECYKCENPITFKMKNC